MPENTLFYGDNLYILRNYIPDNSVDLIYLDPPFNSKRSYNILFKEPSGKQSEAQITAFEDTWHWTVETERVFQEIVDTAPSDLVEMMVAFKSFVGVNDVMAYLTMMAIRLLELKKVLKTTGTIYLHCDPTASHYLKILMDAVFGKRNFRNEIVWCYRGGGYPKKDFGRRHDILLRYTKTSKYNFNLDDVRIPYSEDSKARLKYKARAFREDKVYDTYERNPLGKQPEDWWAMQPIMPSSKERLGYPTQKPEQLLERIMLASSNKGDVILDPFCGCGTTIAVAQKLKRNWIGVDITHLAVNLIKGRLKDMFGLRPKQDYKVIGEPEDLLGAKELASQNRYQFQWWASSLIDARPYQDKKKGSDTGIDALMYFQNEKDQTKKVIVQVKSGHVSVKDIRDLGHVINRESAEIGIFITLEEPTKPMIVEAVRKGFYKSPLGTQYPRIQIKTVEELFRNSRLNIPLKHSMHKKAERSENVEQKKFDY